jgi:hypothetical protein
MTTLNQNSETENKPKLISVNFSSTKRSQWSKYRRYTC